jgi:trinucleotide repeat-containing gene 6 protein
MGAGAGPMGKEGQASPWGHPQPGGGRYGEDMGGGAMWGGKEEPRWSGEGDAWSAGGRPKPGPMRSSPSWEEPGMGGADRWGPRGGPGGGSKDMVWGSKQFRILREMGFREADVETALRQTNMQLEDALEMLNTLGAGRGGMPGRGMPPADVFGPRGEPDFGPRGFPNPGPMPPYGPGGEIPPSNPGMVAPSLSNPNRNMNPNMMINGVQPHAPPRPQQNGPPSTSQLRVLVQQIQMAVQAGHLNPQILNQPLAPQTLLLLNQLLQQIKQLQNYPQQHAMAQAAGQRPGAPSSQALLGLTVQITKHKQQIQNLQNQITAQQAQYLKSQAPQPQQGGGQGPEDILPGLSNMALDQPQGSKFLKLIGDKSSEEFPKAPGAPGSGRAPNSQSSPNLLLENNGPWSNAHGADAGWPSAPGDKPMNTSAEEVDNFGIPEFVPGKAWKGTALKDPSEDPTLTPGSVTSLPAAVTTAENSLGLTSSTWSFNTSNSKDSPAGGPKEPWGNPGPGLPPSSSATNLTAMGQDLWGQSRTSAAPGKVGPAPAGSGWPVSNGGLSTASGWSNGTNGQSNTTMTPTTMAPGQPQAQGSSWLLLKNLTTQIDGSTLQTLCKQHGPLLNFHLYLPHGIALVKYSNGQEAKKVHIVFQF